VGFPGERPQMIMLGLWDYMGLRATWLNIKKPPRTGWFQILQRAKVHLIVQGGAPPSYKLVYNPINYRYIYHKS
jgi:hypothetical protein